MKSRISLLLRISYMKLFQSVIRFPNNSLQSSRSTFNSVERAYSFINALPTLGTHWTIKTTVLRNGMKEGYSNKNNVGDIFKLILMDEEGTTIQVVIFNEEIDRLQDHFSKGKTTLISNGLASPLKEGFSSTHPRLELTLNSGTTVQSVSETIDHGLLHYNSAKIDDIRAITTQGHVDVLGLVVSVDDCRIFSRTGQRGTGTHRKLMIINESNDTLVVTLWGDLAIYEGNFIEQRLDRVCTVLLTNLKSGFYQGRLTWGTTSSTVLLIDPVDGHINVPKTRIKDIQETSKPGFALAKPNIQYTPISISDLLRADIGHFKMTTCYFKAHVSEIRNLENPWYNACTGCKRKVLAPSQPYECTSCSSTSYIPRFMLRMIMKDTTDQITVTLFDVAAVILQCSATDFVNELATAKKEQIHNWVGKGFKFYLDVKTARDRSRGNIVAEKLVKVESIPHNNAEAEAA